MAVIAVELCSNGIVSLPITTADVAWTTIVLPLKMTVSVDAGFGVTVTLPIVMAAALEKLPPVLTAVDCEGLDELSVPLVSTGIELGLVLEEVGAVVVTELSATLTVDEISTEVRLEPAAVGAVVVDCPLHSCRWKQTGPEQLLPQHS